MALRLRTVTTETVPPKNTWSAFEAAKRRWQRAADERRELKARLDGAQAALALAVSPPGKGDHPSPRLIEMANAYLGDRRSATADVLRREIVAQAVEALSLGVEREREVRARLIEIGCGGFLPDAGKEFGVLSEFHSTLSAWNRRMLQSGLLDP